MYLTRQQILEVDDLPAEDVEVPEWGGVVRVRGLTGAERDLFEAAIVNLQGKRTTVKMENVRARLVSLSAVGENGERLFSNADIKALGAKSAAALQRVFDVASRLSGLSEGDVEELVKNSDDGQSDSSISV